MHQIRSIPVLLLGMLCMLLLVAGCSSDENTNHALQSDTGNQALTDSAPENRATDEPVEAGEPKFETDRGEEDRPASQPEPVELQQQDIEAGMLTAGEWNDLQERNQWLTLLAQDEWRKYEQTWGMYTRQGITVMVTDSTQQPLRDVPVILSDDSQDWKGRTNQDGTVTLFPFHRLDLQEGTSFSNHPLSITVGSGRKAVRLTSQELNGEDGMVSVTLDTGHNESTKSNTVDLMLLMDTTGSMSDELSFISAELEDVIQRVRQSYEQELHIRTSINVYRDKGDEYVVRSFPFTDSVDQAVQLLNMQKADGGGDYEEAVDEALYEAVYEHEWSEEAAARICFLILDAPPHATSETISELQQTVAKASEKGIRIIPVASSGVNQMTEFWLRSLAQITGGTYVFLTDHSGIGHSHLPASVGEYEVEFLNDLMVRLITEYVH
ncbi:vWA domain-containing protein [Marinicrinis sediminis]|uniref:VWA domain-containing protein n=1 Tax=Marinicrinis sediminis TaxID=1652465 RepID=A0ABW5RAG3_9BACL